MRQAVPLGESLGTGEAGRMRRTGLGHPPVRNVRG